MPYDVELADRLREVLDATPGLSEKRMFGGLAFLVGGHLAVAAASSGGLLLRCPPEDTAGHVASTPGVERFVMSGRAMGGAGGVGRRGRRRRGTGAVGRDRDVVRRGVGVGGRVPVVSTPPRWRSSGSTT